MPLISLAMIVKNEEACLAHCLESVKPLADEMIVVDTGSTDSTIEIAEGFGARICRFAWCDDFSAARNESLKHCRGDWILILDADEAIDPLDYKKIWDACLNPKADAFSLIHRHYRSEPNFVTHDSVTVQNRSSYSEGIDHPYYSDNEALRLVRPFDGLTFSGRIHEQISPSLYSHGKTFVALDAVIHHYGKIFSDRQEYKAKYYLMLALQEVDKDPLCAHTQFNLMQQALAARQWEVAHRAATACINRNDEEAEPFVLFGNGLALKELGKHEEAIENFDKLLKLNPKHSLAMAQKGSSIVALGNVDAGRQLVVQALELAPGFAPTYQYLANLDFSQNNLDSARRLASEALRIAPNEPGMYDLLMKIDIADNDFEGAAKHALQGIENCLDGAKAVWYSVASAFLLKEGQREAGRSILELGIQAYPEDPELIRLKRMV